MAVVHVTQYLLPIEEAGLLASLGGIQTDLDGVINYCKFLEDHAEISKLNFVVWEAVCGAAVIRYARCFGSGIRKVVPDEIFASATAEIRSAHKYFINVRSKHVAHSVNDFEENEVVVQISADGSGVSEIQAINTQHTRVIGLSFGDPSRLQTLAEWVLLQVNKLVESERERLLPIAKQIGISKIKAFGLPNLGRGGSPTRVHTRRTRP